MNKKEIEMPDRWTSNGMGIHSGEISPERKKAVEEINAWLEAEDRRLAAEQEAQKAENNG